MEATKANADRMARALVDDVNTFLLAKAHHQLMREQMNVIDLELIAELHPVDQYTGKPITDPRNLWCMDDDAAKVYYAKRDDTIALRGYVVEERGYCPALVAEDITRKAERALVDAASPFFPGLTPDKLICDGIEKYHRFTNLIVGLVVNHPDYRKPSLVAA